MWSKVFEVILFVLIAKHINSYKMMKFLQKPIYGRHFEINQILSPGEKLTHKISVLSCFFIKISTLPTEYSNEIFRKRESTSPKFIFVNELKNSKIKIQLN